MSKITFSFFVFVVLVLAGAGCGQPTPTPTPNATDSNEVSVPTSPAGDSGVAQNSVTIEKFSFTPATLTVKKGTIVTWRNMDTVAHTITGNNGGPDSQLFFQGQFYSFTFDTVGTFPYFCKPHPNMKGTITVVE